MGSSPAALAVHGVSKRFGSVVALDDVTFELKSGSCLALVGESGSGKTTLLRCLNRLVDPDSGRVLIDGIDAAVTDPVLLRRRLGYVPQDGGLLPHWRVLRNVALVCRLNDSPSADERARDALALVGLEPRRFESRWPRELSGGQRQRVAIARALAAEPGVLLLDEPFGALDAITRSELQDAFIALRERLGTTTVLVTHDMQEALLLATHVAVMRDGRIEQIDNPRAVVSAPATEYVRALLRRARVSELEVPV
jgi:osmoprotectant transport system ATP-binding protein